MSTALFRFLLYGALMVGIQVVFLSHLTIYRAPADLVFVYGLWLAGRSDRTVTLLVIGVLAGFQDALTDTWGLHLISKTLFFYAFFPLLRRIRDAAFSVPQVFALVLAAAFVFHLIMLTVGGFSAVLDTGTFFWQLLFAGSIYTAFVASIAYLLKGT